MRTVLVEVGQPPVVADIAGLKLLLGRDPWKALVEIPGQNGYFEVWTANDYRDLPFNRWFEGEPWFGTIVIVAPRHVDEEMLADLAHAMSPPGADPPPG